MNSSSGLHGKNKDIIRSEIDVKNKVLKDKRKALIQVLKDKRPVGNEFTPNETQTMQQTNTDLKKQLTTTMKRKNTEAG